MLKAAADEWYGYTSLMRLMDEEIPCYVLKRLPDVQDVILSLFLPM